MQAVRGTLHFGRIGRVALRAHVSLILGLPVFAYLVGRRMSVAVLASLLHDGSASAAPSTWAALLTVGLVLSVALHEGAHALAAWAVGARVECVTLIALGGCTVAHGMLTPARQAAIAAAGPLASLVAGVGLLLGALRLPFGHIDARVALASLAEVQLVLGVIDLVPAPPLDGGRLLVAALERKIGRARATRVAATVGRVIAAVIALASTVAPSLLGIAVAGVIWGGCELALRGAARERALDGVTVRAVMTPPACAVDGATCLSVLAARMRVERCTEWVALDGARLLGVVALEDVARIAPAERGATRVRDVARRAPCLAPDAAAAHAVTLMRRARLAALPVVEHGALVGLVTARALEAADELGRLGDPTLDAPEPPLPTVE